MGTQFKQRLRPLAPFLIIVGMALALTSPQIFNRNIVVGVDGMFHMNRFYDTAMQIKHGQFSWFQMNESFNQSGRIVNALYGPLFAYAAGLLLLMTGKWLIFQLVLNLILECLAGFTMYFLAKELGASKHFSLAAGLIYMSGAAVPAWLTEAQFTSWGAAFMPLVLLFGAKMLHHNSDLPIVAFAVSVALLAQTHLLSAAMAVMALIPLAIAGIFVHDQRGRYIKQIALAALLGIGLTANVWGSMLEVYGSNHLVPPFTPLASAYNATIFSFQEYGVGAAANLGLVLTIITLFQLAVTIVHRQWRTPTGIFTVIGAGFLFLSSNAFPWTTTIAHFPGLASFLQFPSRFRVVALVLMIAAAASSVSEIERLKTRPYAMTIAVIMIGLLAAQTVNIGQRVGDSWSQPQVLPRTSGVVIKAQNMAQVKAALQSPDLNAALQTIQKVAADYLPVPAKYAKSPASQSVLKQYLQQSVPVSGVRQNGDGGVAETSQLPAIINQLYAKSPDGRYRVEVVLNPLVVTRTVLSDGRLQLTWHADSAGNVKLPVVAYAHSQVTLNGHPLPAATIASHRSPIGVVSVRQRAGHNQLTLRYQPKTSTNLLIALALSLWVLVSVFDIYRLIRRRH